MKKSEVLDWLRGEEQQWNALLKEVGPARLDQPGVNGDWSLKDIIAHLNRWLARMLDGLQAALRDEPEPPPPWPADRVTVDQINAWIYEANRQRPAAEILADTNRQFEQLLAVIEALPDDVRVDSGHVLWIGEKYFAVGDFFDHYHDDHEQDIRAWLIRTASQ